MHQLRVVPAVATVTSRLYRVILIEYNSSTICKRKRVLPPSVHFPNRIHMQRFRQRFDDVLSVRPSISFVFMPPSKMRSSVKYENFKRRKNEHRSDRCQSEPLTGDN
jgi:hypothetical protein